MREWLLPLLRCPICKSAVVYRAFDYTNAQGLLEHVLGDCNEVYPVIDGIPRLLVADSRPGLVASRRGWFDTNPETTRLAERWSRAGSSDRVVQGFDDEWRRFRRVGTEDHANLFTLYFDLIPSDSFRTDDLVLDAGCGAGRWAREVATRGPRVIAIDLGMSIELARANTPDDRVACVQADVMELPLAPYSVDWGYSLGVLHHTTAPAKGLANVVDAIKPGGFVLLYLYYALENRGPLFRGLFRTVDLARQIISRQRRPVARALAAIIAASVYWPLARSAAALERLGAARLSERLPLSFYRHLSFETMRNDSLDRFGTPLERRYTREELIELMARCGLEKITISETWPFWHAVGVRLQPSDGIAGGGQG